MWLVFQPSQHCAVVRPGVIAGVPISLQSSGTYCGRAARSSLRQAASFGQGCTRYPDTSFLVQWACSGSRQPISLAQRSAGSWPSVRKLGSRPLGSSRGALRRVACRARVTDLQGMKVTELQEECGRRGLPRFGLRKQELINLILEHDARTGGGMAMSGNNSGQAAMEAWGQQQPQQQGSGGGGGQGGSGRTSSDLQQQLMSMTVSELKTLLKSRGGTVSGTKAVLVERAVALLEQQQQQVEEGGGGLGGGGTGIATPPVQDEQLRQAPVGDDVFGWQSQQQDQQWPAALGSALGGPRVGQPYDWASMTAKDLKAELREMGLPQYGSRAQLIQRLEEAVETISGGADGGVSSMGGAGGQQADVGGGWGPSAAWGDGGQMDEVDAASLVYADAAARMVEGLQLKELQAELRRRGLSTQGTKAQLQDVLQQLLASELAAAQDVTSSSSAYDLVQQEAAAAQLSAGVEAYEGEEGGWPGSDAAGPPPSMLPEDPPVDIALLCDAASLPSARAAMDLLHSFQASSPSAASPPAVDFMPADEGEEQDGASSSSSNGSGVEGQVVGDEMPRESGLAVRVYYEDAQGAMHALANAELYSTTAADLEFRLAAAASAGGSFGEGAKQLVPSLAAECSAALPLVSGPRGVALVRALEAAGLCHVGSAPAACDAAGSRGGLAATLGALGFPTLPTLSLGAAEAGADGDEGPAAALSGWAAEHAEMIDEATTQLVVRSDLGDGQMPPLLARGTTEASQAVREVLAAGASRCVVQALPQGAVYWRCGVLETPRGAIALPPTELQVVDLERDILEANLGLEAHTARTEGFEEPDIQTQLDEVRRAHEDHTSGGLYCPDSACHPLQHVALHTPPRLPKELVQGIRHGAAKLFDSLGLQDCAVLEGYVMLEPGAMDDAGSNSEGSDAASGQGGGDFEPEPLPEPEEMMGGPSALSLLGAVDVDEDEEDKGGAGGLDALSQLEAVEQGEEEEGEDLKQEEEEEEEFELESLADLDPQEICHCRSGTVYLTGAQALGLDLQASSTLALQAAAVGISHRQLLRHLLGRALERAGVKGLSDTEEEEEEEGEGEEGGRQQQKEASRPPLEPLPSQSVLHTALMPYPLDSEEGRIIQQYSVVDPYELEGEAVEPSGEGAHYPSDQFDQQYAQYIEEGFRGPLNYNPGAAANSYLAGFDSQQQQPAAEDARGGRQPGGSQAAGPSSNEPGVGPGQAGGGHGSPEGVQRVWVLMGGDGQPGDASLATGRSVWMQLAHQPGVQAEPFLLAPPSWSARERERRKTLLAKRNKLLELGAEEQDGDLPQQLLLPYIRNPEPGSFSLQGRSVWALPAALAMRGAGCRDLMEAAEQSLRDVNLVDRVQDPTRRDSAEILRTAQRELAACGVPGVAGLWGGDVAATCPPPRYMDLEAFAREAKAQGAVVFNATANGPGDNGDGGLQTFFDYFGVPFTGAGWVATQLCHDRPALAGSLLSLEPCGVSAPPQHALPVAELLRVLAMGEAAIELLYGQMLGMLGGDAVQALCIQPAKGAGCRASSVRIANATDLGWYAVALRDRWLSVPAGTMSQHEYDEVRLVTPPPATLLVEPYIPGDVIVTDSGVEGGGGSAPRPQFADGSGHWAEVTVHLIGEQGNMAALTPTLVLRNASSGSVGAGHGEDAACVSGRGGPGVVTYTPPPESLISREALEAAKQRIEMVADKVGLSGWARIDAFMHADTGEVVVADVDPVPPFAPGSPIMQQIIAHEPEPIYPPRFLSELVHLALLRPPEAEVGAGSGSSAGGADILGVDEEADVAAELFGAETFGDEGDDAYYNDAAASWDAGGAAAAAATVPPAAAGEGQWAQDGWQAGPAAR